MLSHMTAALHRATSGSNANASAASGGGGGFGGGLGGLLASFMGPGGAGGFGGRESQVPVLSCDKPLDLNARLMF